jgi:MinD-like ATPase involved in chromosome partitioning or flagellar assembly
MRQRVYELELLEKSQSAIYTKEHPMLVKTREQLDGARAILEKLDSERMDESTTPNPVILQVEEQLQLKKAKIAGLESVITEKRKQKENFEKQIEELLDIESEMTRIDSEVNVATNSLRQLAEKEEESRVIDELQANKISNVSVFQPASFVERAAKPNKPLLAAAGIVLGILSGFGIAFLKEIGAKSLRSAEQVEQVLRQQVVGQISYSKKNRVSLLSTGELSQELYRDCGGILSRLLAAPSSQWNESENCRTLGVIGVRSGCGASSIATALAHTANSSFGLKTVLVDTDSSSRTTLSSQVKMADKPSLESLIQGEVAPNECIDPNTESGISFVRWSSGGKNADKQGGPVPQYSWKQTAAAIAQFQHISDIVIVDLSPSTAHNQSVLLGCHLDGVVVVIESGETDSLEAERLLERLIHGKANVFGVIVNKIKRAIPRWTENLLGIRV